MPDALETSELSMARSGFGPLLQRDYWAVVRGCRLKPSQVMELIERHFERFAPAELVVFERARAGPHLEVGDRLDLRIVGAGAAAVRVVHKDAQSLTLATLRGHPEAGRITFGAYRNRRGDLVFHIRSRARSASSSRYLGFRGAGEPMQTRCWVDFVNRVAALVGQGVLGWIHVETTRFGDEPQEVACSAPTYLARGD
ncbi:MAG: DUF1990 family protein [Myxococcales bacterium]